MKDKFKFVDDSYTINMYDNGYMVEYGGRDTDDNWIRSKTVCNSIEDVLTLVKAISELPRGN